MRIPLRSECMSGLLKSTDRSVRYCPSLDVCFSFSSFFYNTSLCIQKANLCASKDDWPTMVVGSRLTFASSDIVVRALASGFGFTLPVRTTIVFSMVALWSVSDNIDPIDPIELAVDLWLETVEIKDGY